MKKRIWYVKLDPDGIFPDNRMKLDVFFTGRDGNEYIWTPPWRAVTDIAAAAKFLEETNKPKSEWNQDLKDSYKELQDKSELTKNISNTANLISTYLHREQGSVRISKLFPYIPEELKNKAQQIHYVLSNSENIDDFVLKLDPIIKNHTNCFKGTKLLNKINLIIQKLGLKIDDELNIQKI